MKIIEKGSKDQRPKWTMETYCGIHKAKGCGTKVELEEEDLTVVMGRVWQRGPNEPNQLLFTCPVCKQKTDVYVSIVTQELWKRVCKRQERKAR